MTGAVLLHRFCNIFGAETGGAKIMLGGLTNSQPGRQWYCPNRMIGRYRMSCAHGHQGQIMDLCARHVKQFGQGKVQFCPRCNADPEHHHRCPLTLMEVS